MIKEVVLTLLLVKNPFMSNLTQVKTVRSALAVIEEQTGVRVKLGRIYKTDQAFPYFQGFQMRGYRFATYQKLMLNNRSWNPDRAHLIVDRPLLENGIRYIAGLANTCRVQGGFGIVQTQSFNSFGVDRGVQSAIAVAHEVGHLIGADHHEGITIMNEAASGINPLPTGFDRESIEEIARCLK